MEGSELLVVPRLPRDVLDILLAVSSSPGAGQHGSVGARKVNDECVVNARRDA